MAKPQYFTWTSFLLAPGSEEGKLWLMREFPEAGQTGFEIAWLPVQSRFHVRHKPGVADGDVVWLCEFVQRFLRLWAPETSVGFTFALTCDTHFVGAFSGGSAFVTSRTYSIRHADSSLLDDRATWAKHAMEKSRG